MDIFMSTLVLLLPKILFCFHSKMTLIFTLSQHKACALCTLQRPMSVSMGVHCLQGIEKNCISNFTYKSCRKTYIKESKTLKNIKESVPLCWLENRLSGHLIEGLAGFCLK